ncbi:MAG TPA: thioredoxin family protein [Prolixibacteraceae bacterium]|nr:thioredoxin family protein [Prolixibacteraceae bacterium]
METIQSIKEFDLILAENDAVLAYFSTEACSVCKVLKPKVLEMVTAAFPKLKMIYVESDKSAELAAQHRVFMAPTVVVFFAGRETIRKSRAFGVDELRSEIQRYYSLLFE